MRRTRSSRAMPGAGRGQCRCRALLAFMISLPIAFLSLVPSGTVSPGLFDVIKVVPGALPVPRRRSTPSPARSTPPPAASGSRSCHLAILTVAYGALARVRAAPLRRLGLRAHLESAA